MEKEHSNAYTGQIKGPFSKNTELFDLILQQSIPDAKYITHLGIQSTVGTVVIIDDKEIEIGIKKIYEIDSDENRIKSIKFKDDVDDSTIIDYQIM